MSMKEWMDLDIDKLELPEVTDIEKARVKRHVLQKRKKAPIWRNVAAAAVILVGATVTTGFAFPSVASQIPFMQNVISYFDDEEKRYTNFEAFSTDLGLTQTSNGITVMIDNAVYDGTSITVSYAIETEHPFGDNLAVRGSGWFDVDGATASGGSDKITKIGNDRYVGLATFTPHFEDEVYPETVQVTWEPEAFYNWETEFEVKGDWSFAFSLERLEGHVQLVNETIKQDDMTFTLQALEFTDVSSIITYEQVITKELLEKWPSVTPVFHITDNLGNVYLDNLGGGGVSYDSGITFTGSTTFGTIQEGASQLTIKPTIIASLNFGKGHTKIGLDPIVIEINK